MAQVDFSNAVLDVRSDATTYPMNYDTFMELYSGNFCDSNRNQISSGSVTDILNTPTKVSLLYTGTFINVSTIETEFYIGNNFNRRMWKVSNISFNNGDSYSFIIDIETSGNT